MKTIPLTRGLFALVDDADYENLSKWKWFAAETKKGVFYAARHEGSWRKGFQKTIYMHRALLPGVACVDHHDRNRLNNQRHNLRSASPSQQSQNRTSRKHTSQYKGVSFFPPNRWRVQCNGRHVGLFENEIDAAKAYDVAAKQAFQQYAAPNEELNKDRR